jgi:hypothetical protein
VKKVTDSVEECDEYKGLYDKLRRKGYYCITSDISDLYSLPEAVVKKPAAFTPEDAPGETEYDSVVVDVTDFQFVPALLNRVTTDEGEVYNTAEIRPLYMFSATDAVTRLLQEGYVKPLVIKASEVRTYTEAFVSFGDAFEFYRIKNTKENFPVVFAFIEK